jgi:prophage regulatory protein
MHVAVFGALLTILPDAKLPAGGDYGTLKAMYIAVRVIMTCGTGGKRMPEKILRLPNVLDRTGLSRSTVYLRVTEGRFPRPVSLGARAVGWIETEVEEWIARQIATSRELRGQRTGLNALSSR